MPLWQNESLTLVSLLSWFSSEFKVMSPLKGRTPVDVGPSCKGAWHTGFPVLQEASPGGRGGHGMWMSKPILSTQNLIAHFVNQTPCCKCFAEKAGELSEETLLTLGKNQRKTDYKSKHWDHTWALWWWEPPHPKAWLPRPLRLGCIPSPSSGPHCGQHLLQDTQVRVWWSLFPFIPQAPNLCSNGLGVLELTHLIWAPWTGSAVGTMDDKTSWFRPPGLLASIGLYTGPFWCETTFVLTGMTQVAV